jgi:hypothetical protein
MFNLVTIRNKHTTFFTPKYFPHALKNYTHKCFPHAFKSYMLMLENKACLQGIFSLYTCMSW